MPTAIESYPAALAQAAADQRGMECVEPIYMEMLRRDAHGVVVELGARHGISTTALLAGVEDHGGHVTSIDIDAGCSELFAGHPRWLFINSDSVVAAKECVNQVNLLLIDTSHTYEQTQAEIAAWAPHMAKGGKIYLHDAYLVGGVHKAVVDSGLPHVHHPEGCQMDVITIE